MSSSDENKEIGDKESVKPGAEISGFAPYDLTDGRGLGSWKSRYESEALKAIIWEKKYLFSIFSIAVLLCLIAALFLSIFSSQIEFDLNNYKKYFFTWMGGTIGGVMFCSKWLIHSVAKNSWNIDRQMWRVLTPHLSAALALVFIVLINSEMLNITSPKSLTIHKSFAIGFLVGYFSDNAIGKLTELAQVFFGSGISNKK